MLQLDFKTSYNAVLWHFVDSLSEWDYYVSDHTRRYYTQQWDLTDEDRAQLSRYKELRAPLGWGKEGDLFTWAHEQFTENRYFSQLVPILSYFEDRKNKAGDTLSSVLHKEHLIIRELLTKIKQEFNNNQFARDISKYCDLFNSPQTNAVLDAFLVPSLAQHLVQGGANGSAIYSEVAAGNWQDAFRTTMHEYLHKCLSLQEYFEQNSNKALQTICRTRRPDICHDDLGAFFEEAIVYSISDVIFFGDDPHAKAKRYRAMTGQDVLDIIHALDLASILVPILKEYLHKPDTIEHTRAAVTAALLEFVKQDHVRPNS